MLVLAACCLAPLAAQDPGTIRHELGKRLRRFEQVWAATDASSGGRAPALAAMERAVRGFFGLNLPAVASALDDGFVALRTAGHGDPALRQLAALMLRPRRRVIDPGADLEFALVGAGEGIGAGEGVENLASVTMLTVELEGAGPRRRLQVEADSAEGLSLPIPGEGDRDLRIVARFLAGERSVTIPAQTISVVHDAAARLDRLRARSGGPDRAASIETATLEHLVRMLGPLIGGRTAETDLPVARLLAEAEALAAAESDAADWYGDDRTGQFWLRVPIGRGAPILRLAVPPRDPAGAPRPLVLALHGMGGTENLFFDGYGDGLAARLCAERGWFLCAPRNLDPADAAPLIDALAARWSIDHARIFVVGHSMGAATTLAAAQHSPGCFARIAALGGGSAIRDPDALRGIGAFVGVGTRDFALGGARTLVRRLTAAAIEPLVVREYPEIEHMLVVQVALPEVFDFFAH